MKVLYYTIAILLFVIFLVGYEFSTKPLKFKLNSYWEFFGWLFVFAGIIMITMSYRKTEYYKGYEDALKDVSHFNKTGKMP